jgi:hypothetical protein
LCSGKGGGIYATGTSIEIINNFFIGNYSLQRGAAVFSSASRTIINNNYMTGNTSHCNYDKSCIVYLGTGIVSNNIMYGNYIYGIHAYPNLDSVGVLYLSKGIAGNNTIVNSLGSYSFSVSGGGHLINNLLWNNGTQEIFGCDITRYNCVTNGNPGEGNISTTPLFAAGEIDTAPSATFNALTLQTTFEPSLVELVPDKHIGWPIVMTVGGNTDTTIVVTNTEDSITVWGNYDSVSPITWQLWDYHQVKESPTVDAGTTNGGMTTDVEGQLRPTGYGVDMGADESGRFRPGAPGIEITPPEPYSDNPLVCTVIEGSLVGESVTPYYEFTWSSGGVVVTHGPKEELSDTLNAQWTVKNETWTCSVRCWDGGEYSLPAITSVVIQNTPPGTLTLELPP